MQMLMLCSDQFKPFSFFPFDFVHGTYLNLTVQVFKAKRIATMKMIDDGYEEKAKERKSQKLKTLAEKGLLKRKRRNKKL